MPIDANLLLFAVDETAPDHDRAAAPLEEQLNGDRRVALPWESLTAFVRIATHPRASDHPLKPDEAWRFVTDWLSARTAWVPLATERHAGVLGGLIRRYRLAGNLVPDAHLAAIAIEHGLEVCSADTDFAHFTEIRWRNPLAG
ncbi:MAG: twitching motility protein PilT [Chloroflexi bacterium GWC2_73_18]|nr:MAG: twitching motility protein PilT [Chloroflexi bacterium GWC2_73_18]